MNVIPRIGEMFGEMQAIRHDLHAHPETAFEEARTSDLIAARLAEYGIEVHRGIAGTGVVGRLSAGSGRRSIALRADMDALHIREQNEFAHRSRHPGRMHACGHDGHAAMLLGAAKYLAETRDFDGSVTFIFQPAEENEGGARVMIEQGLFERHPVECVFGMHNWPEKPPGWFGLRSGPMMASFDLFEVTLRGSGAHAALPHLAADPVIAAAATIQALQTVVSRNVDPIDTAVVTVTQVHAGDTWNVIPDEAVLRGTTRVFDAGTQTLIERRIRDICQGLAAAHGVQAGIRYERRYPPLVNNEAEAAICAQVLRELVGADNVDADCAPTMGAEDFAFMLQARPGCYVFIGSGSGEGGCLLHNPRYDFNDGILTLGASYWARLTAHLLPVRR